MIDYVKQLQDAQDRYEKSEKDFAEPDNEYAKRKGLLESKLGYLSGIQKGTSEAQRKGQAMQTVAYKAENNLYLEAHLNRAKALAEKNGAKMGVDTARSILSYNKSLIDKGIWSPESSQ